MAGRHHFVRSICVGGVLATLQFGKMSFLPVGLGNLMRGSKWWGGCDIGIGFVSYDLVIPAGAEWQLWWVLVLAEGIKWVENSYRGSRSSGGRSISLHWGSNLGGHSGLAMFWWHMDEWSGEAHYGQETRHIELRKGHFKGATRMGIMEVGHPMGTSCLWTRIKENQMAMAGWLIHEGVVGNPIVERACFNLGRCQNWVQIVGQWAVHDGMAPRGDGWESKHGGEGNQLGRAWCSQIGESGGTKWGEIRVLLGHDRWNISLTDDKVVWLFINHQVVAWDHHAWTRLQKFWLGKRV
jgi:hypothetical protein